MDRWVGGWMIGCVSEGASASGLCWQGCVCGHTHETKRHSSGKITVRRTDRLCSEHCHETERESVCGCVCGCTTVWEHVRRKWQTYRRIQAEGENISMSLQSQFCFRECTCWENTASAAPSRWVSVNRAAHRVGEKGRKKKENWGEMDDGRKWSCYSNNLGGENTLLLIQIQMNMSLKSNKAGKVDQNTQHKYIHMHTRAATDDCFCCRQIYWRAVIHYSLP